MHRKLPGPLDAEYWDREALEEEERRVFLICNGCRLCWNLCPSFPHLFEAVDALDSDDPVVVDTEASHDGPHVAHVAPADPGVMGQLEALDKLDQQIFQDVVDLCYQCKLCDPICPFTPPHEHAVDFPRLMLRHKAVDAKEKGVALNDRILGDPDLVGKLGTMLPAVANFGAGVKLNRIMMEKVAGIHRDRQLPPFASETFRSWFQKRHPTPQPPPDEVEGRKVVLFYTCSVQWNEPQVGRAAVEVLERNGITVYAPELRCCGMPALDGGDVPRATEWARHNVERLLPYVRAGCEVLSPGPTCSYMIKHEWKDYLGTPESEEVAAAGKDLMEYLHLMRKAGELDQDFGDVPEQKVGYHLPCHLKVQKIGFRSRDVMKRIPGTTVKVTDRCSCMDGTWGMKTEYYDLSKQWAKKTLDDLVEGEPDRLASDCLIAKLQIEENTGMKVQHPIEVLWEAYQAPKSPPADDEDAP